MFFINCIYSKLGAKDAAYEHYTRPEELKDAVADLDYYKSSVTFTDPVESEAAFYVHSVGYEQAFGDQSADQTFHRDKTVFYYALGGEGYFNGRPVRRGDCLIAVCGTPHSVSAKPDKAFSYAWITVLHDPKLSLSVIGLDVKNPIFKYDFCAEVRQIVHSLLSFNPKTHDPYFFTLGKFFELLSYHKSAKPEKEKEKSSIASHARYVSLAKNMLEESGYTVSVEEIAKAIGFSRKYLSMIFCQTTGITLRDFIAQKKIERAKAMLVGGEASLKTIAFQLNYNDYSSFSRAFKKESGLTPHEYVSAHAMTAEE